MSGDCETLLSPAAVIKAIRDKFPTRALYSMAQTRHPANKGVIKTVIGNRDSWVTTSWRAFSLRLRPPWTCLLRPDSLSLSLSLSPGMQLCALETRKMDRNLEMSQRYPGPGRQQVLGSRVTWSLHGDKAQASISLLLLLRVVSNWTLHIVPAPRERGRREAGRGCYRV